MKKTLKSIWLINISILIFALFSDIVSKSLVAEHLTGPSEFLFFRFLFVENPGLIFGSFSQSTPLFRVVFLSSLGALLLFVYFFIQFLISFEAPRLRMGLSFLMGGILGNVFDRIYRESVIDFIQIKIFSLQTGIFNLADFWQWVGYIFIAIAVFKEKHILKTKRQSYWSNPYFQIKYCFILVIIGLSFSLIIGVFFYTYLDHFVISQKINAAATKENLLIFFASYGALTMIFLVSLFIIGQFLSHRMAGPIYAFELYIKDILKGKQRRKFSLRKKDEFQNLQTLAEQIKEKIHTSEQD